MSAKTNASSSNASSEEAAEAFLEPFYVVSEASINFEERQFVLSYSLAERLVLVVHIERGAKIRIISARVATRTERRLYEQS